MGLVEISRQPIFLDPKSAFGFFEEIPSFLRKIMESKLKNEGFLESVVEAYIKYLAKYTPPTRREWRDHFGRKHMSEAVLSVLRYGDGEELNRKLAALVIMGTREIKLTVRTKEGDSFEVSYFGCNGHPVEPIFDENGEIADVILFPYGQFLVSVMGVEGWEEKVGILVEALWATVKNFSPLFIEFRLFRKPRIGDTVYVKGVGDVVITEVREEGNTWRKEIEVDGFSVGKLTTSSGVVSYNDEDGTRFRAYVKGAPWMGDHCFYPEEVIVVEIKKEESSRGW